MGKVIAIILSAVIFLGVWQWVSAAMQGGKIETAMRDVLDLSKNLEQGAVEKALVEMSTQRQLDIVPEEVHAQISLGQPQGISGNLTERHGIGTVNKKIILQATQHYAVLGMKRKSEHLIEQNYTMSAQMQSDRPYILGE